jgi:hypothetical protein
MKVKITRQNIILIIFALVVIYFFIRYSFLKIFLMFLGIDVPIKSLISQ